MWSLVGAAVAQGSTLASSIISARLLGREEFGALGMIQSTVGMLGVFAGLGLGMTATKYVAELRTRDPHRAGRIIALGTAVAIVSGGALSVALMVFAPLLASETLNAPELVNELRVAGILLFFNAVSGAQTGALSGLEAFRAIAQISLLRGLATLPLTLGFVLCWGLPGAVWALAIAGGLCCFVNRLSLQHQCEKLGIRPRIGTAWRERRVLWTYSTPAFLSGAVVGPAMWGASTMLVNQPNGYAEMGLFNAANHWRSAVAFLPGILTQPLLAILSSIGISNRKSVARIMRVQLLAVLGVSGFVAAPLILCSSSIMSAYGASFRTGETVLSLLVVSAVISATANVVGQVIASMGDMWLGLLMNLMWAAVMLAISAALIPKQGAQGLAQALLAAYFVHAAIVGLYVQLKVRTESATKQPSADKQPSVTV